jgi:hypothetical protein
MRKMQKVATAALVVAAAGVVGAAGPASADPGPGRDFGQHVAEHHDEFTGDHNPGVHHRGFSGWEEHMQEHHD